MTGMWNAFLFILGCILRVYFCLFKDNSLDDVVFQSYIAEPDPISLQLANYPPLFMFLSKGLYLIFPFHLTAQVFVLSLSLINYGLLWHFFSQKKAGLFSLALLVFYTPTLYASTQVSPVALMELLGSLIFLLFQQEKDWNRTRVCGLITLLLLLTFTSYSTALFLIFLLILYGSLIRSTRARVLLALGGLGLGVYALQTVRWSHLTWLQSMSPWDTLHSVYLAMASFAGYSVINLFVLATLCWIHRKKIPALALRTQGLLLAMLMTVGFLLSSRVSEPRFFIFCTGFVLLSLTQILQSENGHRGRFVRGIFILFVAKATLSFAYNQRSGFDEVLQALQKAPPQRVVTFDLHRLIASRFQSTENKSSCSRAFIGRKSSLEAEVQIQQIQAELLPGESLIVTRRPSLEPLFYALTRSQCP